MNVGIEANRSKKVFWKGASYCFYVEERQGNDQYRWQEEGCSVFPAPPQQQHNHYLAVSLHSCLEMWLPPVTIEML